MGAYLNKPDKKVHLVEGSTSKYDFAAGSMRGWRMSNEDAHSCLTNFDDGASLFAVFDGHGGAEVAECAAEMLPDFIKKQEAYKNGDYGKALELAFIEFDKFLYENEEILKPYLDKQNGGGGDESSEPGPECGPSVSSENADQLVEDVDSGTLREEAQLPLDQLLGQYKDGKAAQLFSKYFNSPLVEKKLKNGTQEPSTSSSEEQATESNKNPGTDDDSQPSSSKAKKEIEAIRMAAAVKLTKLLAEADEMDSDEDSEFDPESSEDGDGELDETNEDDEAKEGEEVHGQKKEDASDKDKDNDADDEEENDDDEDDEEGEDDEDDEEQSDEEESSDEEILHIPYAQQPMKPGHDSGCTAVVALIKDNTLYVASAGDSRCILFKQNECIPMSFDHKPTDELEVKRITAAGGRVTSEGRVNGGLNLSRALGDFTYKNMESKPEDQMISPFPQVIKHDLSSNDYDYIVVACDGIWNSMENEDLRDFVYATEPMCDGDLTELIRAIFQNCIAEDTQGDGTGCDNMTCIILKLKHNGDKKEVQESATINDLKADVPVNTEPSETTHCAVKRKQEVDSNDCPSSLKRKCIDL